MNIFKKLFSSIGEVFSTKKANPGKTGRAFLDEMLTSGLTFTKVLNVLSSATNIILTASVELHGDEGKEKELGRLLITLQKNLGGDLGRLLEFAGNNVDKEIIQPLAEDFERAMKELDKAPRSAKKAKKSR